MYEAESSLFSILANMLCDVQYLLRSYFSWLLVDSFFLQNQSGKFISPPLFVMQHTSMSPDSKTVVVVGDNSDGLLADSQSGKVKKLWSW